MARGTLSERAVAPASAPPETPSVEPDNACVRVIRRGQAATDREAWDEFEQLFAPEVFTESRRKITGGFIREDFSPNEARRLAENGALRLRVVVIAVRGERLALARLQVGTADVSPGAPHDEMLELFGLDEEGRIATQVSFDIEDMEAAVAELDAAHARFAELQPKTRRLENAAALVFERVWSHFAARDWDALADTVADNYSGTDHRRVVNAGIQHGRDAVVQDLQVAVDVGFTISLLSAMAIRGERLVLARVRASGSDPEAVQNDALNIVEIDTDERIAVVDVFDIEDIDAAFAELDSRYLAGEAAPYAQTWSVVTQGYASINRGELPPTTPDWVNVDHRRGTSFAPGDLPALLTSWNLAPGVSSFSFIDVVHRLNNLGAVITSMSHETSPDGVNAEWRVISVFTLEGDLINRLEVFDETDIDAAIATFEGCNPKRGASKTRPAK